MLIVWLLDAAANPCLILNRFLVLRLPFEGDSCNFIGRVRGLGAEGGLRREKEKGIILEQQPNVIVAFVSGER